MRYKSLLAAEQRDGTYLLPHKFFLLLERPPRKLFECEQIAIKQVRAVSAPDSNARQFNASCSQRMNKPAGLKKQREKELRCGRRGANI